MITPAPLYDDIADGPKGGAAYWITTEDGVRLRAAYWPGGDKGTILMFPGRTEYVEKYGPTAAAMAQRGYGVLCIDWRGQGLSDRALPDKMSGHVHDFAEYQLDIHALLALADTLEVPKPRFLISHSMGGCIALRALLLNLPVRAAVFSAPMWGIRMMPAIRPVAVMLTGLSRLTGQYHRYTPGTKPRTYVTDAPFAGNVLTTDPDMYAWMKTQVTAHPDLALGGPSLGWLHAAMAECRALAALPSPHLPTVCALGSAEKVVDTAPIRARMAKWKSGHLNIYQSAEHEVIMETPAHRTRFFDHAAALFDANA